MHSFYIPVMGIGFTIDTPLKVAKYGISSVISLVDDDLIEDVRKKHCENHGIEFTPILPRETSHRSKRITAYLNLLDVLVKKQIETVKNSGFAKGSELDRYFSYLPESSSLKKKFNELVSVTEPMEKTKLEKELVNSVVPGDIDVNIMVKLDKDNFLGGVKLAPEFSDALAALQGYALSTLHSSIILSAGFNRRLMTFMEGFSDFFPAGDGSIKKKVSLKVSDFRSAQTQSRFFAKKGLWVSEYRLESGLNCGGHAFATEGELMGPILEEFKDKRHELIDLNFASAKSVWKEKYGLELAVPPAVRFTAQGGIGTHEEHEFLMEHYGLDAVGWGSPFLLVPETVNIDPETLKKLSQAGEKDIRLSDISPLGIRFYTLNDSKSEINKKELIRSGNPGSTCTKGFLKINQEMPESGPVCVSSKQYQNMKINELKGKDLSPQEYQFEYDRITDKACLCRDLSGSAEINYKMEKISGEPKPAVCPGPNLAFFSKTSSLEDMIGHIYGRKDLINGVKRPHVFMNELKLYMKNTVELITTAIRNGLPKQWESLRETCDNLKRGMEYYRNIVFKKDRLKKAFNEDLEAMKEQLGKIIADNPKIFPTVVPVDKR